MVDGGSIVRGRSKTDGGGGVRSGDEDRSIFLGRYVHTQIYLYIYISCYDMVETDPKADPF